MKKSLRTRMLFQYVGIVLICMVVIPTSISELLNWQFKRFAGEKLMEDRQEIILLLQEIYSRENSWNNDFIQQLHGDFLRWPIISATVYDSENKEVKVFARRQMKHVKTPDGGKRPFLSPRRPPEGSSGKLLTIEDPIIVRGIQVGKISFVCLPFKDSRDGIFLNRFNKMLYMSVAFMLMIAVLISFFMADRISRPVLMAAKRAYQISKGDYNVKDGLRSDIAEIQTLIDSMDRLGMALEEQEILRKRLTSDIAHELRNPVTVVKSHLEAFEDKVWEPTPERIKLTVDEIERLSRLISEVEKLSVIESTDSKLSISSVDMSEALEKIALSFDPLFANKSVTLKRDIQGGLEAAVDTSKMRQAFENILSNALRYTDSGGTVYVKAEKTGNEIVVSFRDTGIGISKEDLPNIFERFYRTDKSRTRASGGMGIGLAITRAIIEAHGGAIGVESKEGEGTVFTVSLPLNGNKSEMEA